jgi:hypothetical protein
MPGHFRDRFSNLKTGYDKLESDHRTLKGQFDPWKAVIEKHGDPAAAANDLEAISGLRNFKFGEDGNIVFDQTTGQPVYDVRPSLEKIVGQNPAMAGYLFDELMTFQDPESGDNLGRAFLNALGLNPDKLEDYRNYDPSKIATSNDGVDPQVRADVVAKYGQQFGEVFDSMASELQTEFPYMEESSKRVLLEQAAKALDDSKFKDEIRQYQENQHRQATANWDAAVQAEEDTFLGGLRDSVFDSVLNDVANQVSISANPQINAMYTQMTRVTFAALLDPSPGVRAAVAPMLQAAGVNLDFAGLDRAVTQAKQLGAQYARLKNLASKPGYKGAPIDARSVEDVRAKAEGSAQNVSAYLSQVALRISQSLGGQIKQDAAAVDQKLREARDARPVVTGSAPTVPAQVPVKRGAPFSRERYEHLG